MHAQSCLTLCDVGHKECVWPIWTIACQAPLFMGFSRQEYWSMLPFPTPGDLPDTGIELPSLTFTELAGRFFTISAHDIYMRACVLSHFSHARLFVTL